MEWQGALIVVGCIGGGVLFGAAVGYLIVNLQRKRGRRKLEEPRIVEKPPPLPASGLLAEIKGNLQIATRPWRGELVPFQTSLWDTSRDGFKTIPAHLQQDLSQAYADMRLANDIVWLSKELGRRSRDLDESYRKLCNRIVVRLEKVVSDRE